MRTPLTIAIVDEGSATTPAAQSGLGCDKRVRAGEGGAQSPTFLREAPGGLEWRRSAFRPEREHWPTTLRRLAVVVGGILHTSVLAIGRQSMGAPF